MAEDTRKKMLVELLLEMGGGFGAGVLDVETAAHTPMGLSYGAIVGSVGAIAAIALGPKALKGAMKYIGDAAGGMLAFESGAAGANWRINAKTAAGTTGLTNVPIGGYNSLAAQANKTTPGSGVAGRMGQGSRVVSQADLYDSINALESLAAA